MVFTKDKSFYRNLIVLAFPMVLQNLITFLVGFADNVMIGSLGDSAVSGVYMGNQLQTALQVLSAGIEGAILLLSAQYWGKRDTESVRRIVAGGMLFAAGLGVLFTTVSVLFPGQLIRIFTSEESVVEAGTEYLAIVGWSFLFFCITQALIASMRSVERATIGLYVSSASLVANILLNWVLIYGKLGAPALGVKGAAIATLISRIIETAVILIYVKLVDKRLNFRFSSMLHPDGSFVRDLVKYGAPIMAGQLVWGCNLMANSMIMGQFSEAVITATSVANTANNMIYVAMNGLAGAVGIIVGKTVGSGNVKKVREYAVTVQLLFLMLGVLTGAMLAAIRYPFISLFDITEEAARVSATFIGILCFTSVGTCYQCASLFGLVKSGGDVGFVFKNDTIFVFLVVIPSGLITMLCGCPTWVVYLCLKCDQILKCIVAFFKIRKYNWMKNLTKNPTPDPDGTIPGSPEIRSEASEG